MCGISGFIDSRLSLSEAHGVIDSMLEKISHRGPDARDKVVNEHFAFGHNRLSIIDLSEDGKQPMSYFNSTIVFNGEIYNYREIRKELEGLGYRFSTSSDTEVVLAAYRHYGTDCVKKFVGMWALALWDHTTNRFFCSRDRFGIKPFNYIFKDGRFYFSSEYKALKVSPVFTSDINLAQMYRGLQLGWIAYHDETYFQCINALPAACNLFLENGKLRIEKYWDVDLSSKFSGSAEEKSEVFRSMFLDSIQLHMRADVEVGGCLSGGLDSSAIACAVAKMYPEVDFKTFTIFYQGKDAVDERPWVQKVLQANPNLKNYELSPSENDIAEGFERALYFADVPIAGSSPVSQYFVMGLARSKGLKVVLDGQGSDEYLAGYMHSYYRLLGGMLSQMRLGKFLSTFGKYSSVQGFSLKKRLQVLALSSLSSMRSEQELYAYEYKKYYPFLPLNDQVNFDLGTNARGSRLNRFLYQLLFNTSLPHLLHYEDRNSMAFSIESRVPFLDHRLVEFVFSLNDEDKIDNSLTKKVLRDGLKDILPKDILQRTDKKGFVTPGEVKWLKGPLKYLLEDKIEIPGIRNELIAKEIKAFESGDMSRSTFVWRIVVLNKWLKAVSVA